jgi:hypothetical protein
MVLGKPFKYIQGILNTRMMKFKMVDDENVIQRQLIAAVMNQGSQPTIASFKLEQNVVDEK